MSAVFEPDVHEGKWEVSESEIRMVHSVIARRPDSPTLREEIIRVTGLDDRTIRSCINALRKQGVPIVIGPGGRGYEIARERGSVVSMIARIDSSIEDQQAVKKGLERALDKMGLF